MRTLPLLALVVLGCRAAAPGPPLATARFPAGDAIVVAGEPVPIGAPVVLWTMEPRYDAYAERPRFAESGEAGKRYRPGREPRTEALAAAVERDGWTRGHLREQVDLLVLHYDACGTSARCFRVLHDERQLSAHFLLDVDGTLYQTLDLADTAWHARAANARSIGVEIGHVGAYPPEERERFTRHYEWTEHGTRLRLADDACAALRFPDYAGGPAREGYVEGPIHGERFVQPDFTDAQYASLAALAAALARELPRIALDAPRNDDGDVRTDALTDAEEADFAGVVGHFHLQADKRDPGPAFDWERFLAEARSRAVEP